MTAPRTSRGLLLAGLALILLPALAVFVKFLSIGWLTVAMMWFVYIPVLLALGWIVQIVIAATGYFGRHAALARRGSTGRGIAAAWVTSLGVLLTAFFVVDGGDTSWGSTFMYWTGLASDSTAGDVSTMLAYGTGLAWLIGWLWLVIEWVIAITLRIRDRRSRQQRAGVPTDAS